MQKENRPDKKTKSDTGRALSPDKLKAISLLSKGATRSETAKTVGIAERTIYNWLAEPEFASALKEAQRAVLDALCSGLATAALVAVRYLANVASGNEQGDKLRIRASAALLSSGLNILRVQELAQLEERIKSIEANLGVGRNGVSGATH